MFFSRKAPYHFEWDWGPRLVPSGIWRPVVLEAWHTIKIDNVFIKQPSVTKQLAQLEAEINFISSKNLEIKAEIYHNKKKLAEKNIKIQEGNNLVNLPFSIKNPRLWWSNGLGKAELYDFEIVLKQDNQQVASYNIQTGLRSLKLVRKKDEAGESFYFELNGIPVFAKGANSIPNDVFLPRITREDYEKMVLDAYHANMNMIRIWGGGIYEDDYFYELCDKYGIMVWQDFMFACAMYPGNEEFLENVKEEAIDNIIRLRNHPCIALWCGNNEIDAAWARWGWQRPYNEEEKQQIFKAYTNVFHELLPDLVTQYTDGDDYWASSPISGPEINAHEIRASTHGDNHYWGVWHEKQLFNEYENNIGRFISEHGFQSFPEFSTVTQYALPEDYNIESEVMAAHQRSGIRNLRIKEYMGWYYNIPEDFEQFLYMSQVLQAQAMKEAMRTHRRHMPYCMGSLVWQLNDCWQVASWSTTDYYHKWKAAHYALRDACKNVIISSKLSDKELEIWVVNDNLNKINGILTIEIKDFNGHTLDKIEQRFNVKENSSEKVRTFLKSELLKQYNDKEILAVVSLQEGKKIWDNQFIYFQEAKDLNLPENPSISIELINKNNKYFIRASTDKLARNVMFYISGIHLGLSNNYFDLLPNQVYEIEIFSPSIQKINNNRLEIKDEKGEEIIYTILPDLSIKK
ncbi:MAG: glycoside hydrolase family 2 protein [Odoribacter sp.]|nr:glycoside hydrolase family 2 protein [Odoribacter sp.]